MFRFIRNIIREIKEVIKFIKELDETETWII